LHYKLFHVLYLDKVTKLLHTKTIAVTTVQQVKDANLHLHLTSMSSNFPTSRIHKSTSNRNAEERDNNNYETRQLGL